MIYLIFKSAKYSEIIIICLYGYIFCDRLIFEPILQIIIRTFCLLSAGITANYKLSRNCFLLLNVNYIQPLGRFTYRKYVTDLYTGEKVERGVYKSSTFARDLNVSVGFGFPFYLGRKTNRKSSHRERTRQLMEQKRKTYGLFPGNK